MKMPTVLLAVLLAISASAQTQPKAPAKAELQVQSKAPQGPALHWVPWSDAVFAQAKREHRFVLLDLEAVWCHWCHVMAETTYKDPEVIRLLQSKYITVRADQDARPDLSNCYEDYGWPATVVFDGNGQEIIKRQGYLNPAEMASVLQAIIDDPSPGPSVEPEERVEYSSNALLPAALRAQLQKTHLEQYDRVNGSWGFRNKYLDWDSVEFALGLAKQGDAREERMARQTLAAQLHLMDPAWGGVYQYSTGGDWKEPHFEKIMLMQAENLRIYALAYAQWREPAHLRAAQEIHRFLKTFLTSPQGAFYVSQDADLVRGKHSAHYFQLIDSERRKLGVPRVDTHIYARENGWAITALATLYGATGEQAYLDESLRAAAWIIGNRALPKGGFRHDAKDVAGPYLGDTLSMARAFLTLYGVTGDRQWLGRAEASTRFIAENFKNPGGAGYVTAKTATDSAYAPHPQRDENGAFARVANLLSHYTGNLAYHQMAEEAMRYLEAPPVARRLPASLILLVDQELTHPPLHLTIVGGKDDPAARALFQAALRYPASYKRVEWWDTREEKLPNPDVQYPQLAKAAAFVCTERTCSPPMFNPADIQAKVDRLLGVSRGAALIELPAKVVANR